VVLLDSGDPLNETYGNAPSASVVGRTLRAGSSSVDGKALVLAAVDIVDLIGQTVALKRRGAKYIGLCPFHKEKSPSFNVDPGKQYFHCFGCKKGGNAIDFVIERDRVEFKDALHSLAEAYKVELPKFGGSKEKSGERQQLLEANASAVVFFENLLSSTDIGQVARDYLTSRGFTDESIKRFHLGVAVDSWDALVRGPLARKFNPQLLVTAGLAKARNGRDGNPDPSAGVYDTFRNRLMFPIRDDMGRTIAFGGRVLPGSEDPAKYLNSPETPLFSKSRCCYGLDLAKRRITETRVVAVVEGYTDVVMAHQYGASNVVSVLGTALTEQHVSLLRRFADKIVLLFDPDSAGDLAVNRAVELFLTQPIEIQIATLPEDLDPDEFLLKYGVEGFDKVLSGAQDALSYKWTQLSRDFRETGDLTSQQKAVSAYLDVLSQARGSGPVDSIRWGSALSRVSRLTEIPVDELHKRFKNVKGPARIVHSRATVRGTSSSSARASVFREGVEVFEHDVTVPPRVTTAQDRAECWILSALLAHPEKWNAVQTALNVDEFQDATRRRLAEIYWAHQTDEGEPVFAEFLGTLRDQAASELEADALCQVALDLMDESEHLLEVDQALNDAVQHFKRHREQKKEFKLYAQLRRSSGSGQNDSSAGSSLPSSASSDEFHPDREPDDLGNELPDDITERMLPTDADESPVNGSKTTVIGSKLPVKVSEGKTEAELFVEFVKKNTPSLHRLGPVRRAGS